MKLWPLSSAIWSSCESSLKYDSSLAILMILRSARSVSRTTSISVMSSAAFKLSRASSGCFKIPFAIISSYKWSFWCHSLETCVCRFFWKGTKLRGEIAKDIGWNKPATEIFHDDLGPQVKRELVTGLLTQLKSSYCIWCNCFGLFFWMTTRALIIVYLDGWDLRNENTRLP